MSHLPMVLTVPPGNPEMAVAPPIGRLLFDHRRRECLHHGASVGSGIGHQFCHAPLGEYSGHWLRSSRGRSVGHFEPSLRSLTTLLS